MRGEGKSGADGVDAMQIMEFIDGRIFQNPSIPGVSKEERRLMYAYIPPSSDKNND